jgi:hypothetical protein
MESSTDDVTAPGEQAQALPIEDNAIARGQWAARFLVGWVVTNSVGAVFGLFVADSIVGGSDGSNYWNSPVEAVLRLTAAGLIIGTFIGFFEWQVIQSYMPGLKWWIPATAIAWGLAFPAGSYIESVLWNSLGDSLSPGETERWIRVIEATVIGTILGFIQSAALRQRIARTEFWVLAYPMAGTFVFLTLQDALQLFDRFVPSTFQPHETLVNILLAVWVFSVLECITGLTLIRLLGLASTHEASLYRNETAH